MSIIRVFFSAFIKSIIFFKITNSLVIMLEKTYNFTIATFNSFISFFYICITILKFDFAIFINFDFEDFDFEDFDLANLINFDFAILNMLITNNKLRFLFYNTSILNRLNFNNSLIKYFSKNFAILFN